MSRRTPAASAHPPARRRIRLSVTGQITFLVVLARAVPAGLGHYSSPAIHQVRSETDQVATAQGEVGAAQSSMQDALWTVRNLIITTAAYPPNGKQAQFDALSTAEDDLDAALATFDDEFAEAFGHEPADWGKFTSALANYRAGVKLQLIPAAQSDDRYAWSATRDGSIGALGDALVASVAGLGAEVHDEVAKVSANADRETRTAIVTTVVVIVLGILATTIVGIVIATAIRRSVAEVKRSIDAVARGDLTVVPDVRTTDELGEMARGLATALGALSDLIGDVVQSAHTVPSSSE